ncbi:hypothetical protein [Endozoicomonas sp. ONNA1]|uniref:hypothetical protein n=1 Tax=Endozoicomonas sp. ONNA1 TaxID=2828740 RepID=UPI00214948CD|nr:hypothetical protein [Endozoicomonas sp. ONNA1]
MTIKTKIKSNRDYQVNRNTNRISGLLILLTVTIFGALIYHPREVPEAMQFLIMIITSIAFCAIVYLSMINYYSLYLTEVFNIPVNRRDIRVIELEQISADTSTYELIYWYRETNIFYRKLTSDYVHIENCYGNWYCVCTGEGLNSELSAYIDHLKPS